MLAPKDEAELSEMVRAATGPLWIEGGGTRGVGPATNGTRLSVAGLSGITLYEPGALTVVARAGTPLAEIEAALAAENQRLPFEPMDHRALLGTTGEPTIGGVVAGNVSGSRRIQAGACRDSLIGVRFVDGRGDVLKNGGRVMKNVTGYDLVKLMAGSFGTLGVLSEVSFKLLPRTAVQATLILDDQTELDAVKTMSAALGTPYEISGAAHGPVGLGQPGATYLRIEGFEASVAYRVAELRRALAGFGEARLVDDPADSAQIWKDLTDVRAFADQEFVAKVSIKPSDFPEFGFALSQAVPCSVQLDWGGGLAWVGATAAQLERWRSPRRGCSDGYFAKPLHAYWWPRYPGEGPARTQPHRYFPTACARVAQFVGRVTRAI